MKHYRNLNGCVSKMRRVIYDAYDRGYKQGRTDYERHHGEWKFIVKKTYTSFECSNCKSLSIAKYTFCPHCGSPMTEDAYDKD